MKDNLTKAKYLIYAYVGFSLLAFIYGTGLGFYRGYIFSTWESMSVSWSGVWWFFYSFGFPFFLTVLVIYFCFEIFERGRGKFKWGLFTIALYHLLTRVSSAIYILVLVRSGGSQVVLQQFQQPIYYIGLLFLISFIYGVYLLMFTKMPENETASKGTIKQEPSDEISDKDFLPTLILCFFVGMLGIHRFYAGKVGTGIAMIATLGGLGIWVLIDFIMICIGSFRDIDGRIIKYQRAVIAPSSSETGIAEELEKFSALKDKGIISEEEFNKKKEELLK